MDEWRFALIDEVPVRKQKHGPKVKRAKKRCLPCFFGDEDQTTDPEWAHFKPPLGKNTLEGNYRKQTKRPGPRLGMPPSRSRIAGTGAKRLETEAKSQHEHKKAQTKPALRNSVDAPKGQDHVENHHDKELDKREHRSRITNECGQEPHPLRSQSAQAQLDREVKIFEREHLSPRPYQSVPGQEISRGLTNMQATGSKGERVCPSSAYPTSCQCPDTLISKLEEALNKTAELGADAEDPQAANKKPSKQCGKGQQAVYDAGHVGVCCRFGRGIPSQATAPPNIPKRTSSIPGSINLDEMDLDDQDIADRDVLRGLHVAASAACDEEVDAFVRSKTGLRIRRFLADLVVLEAFREPLSGEDSEKRARRRRADMRKLKQQVRRSREMVVEGGRI
ncbi:hypothetical protein RJ55_07833 [Drechmeria coniospora]|nr:hypothetical protein RJ55_07833 [Drechmeria coniospora]